MAVIEYLRDSYVHVYPRAADNYVERIEIYIYAGG